MKTRVSGDPARCTTLTRRAPVVRRFAVVLVAASLPFAALRTSFAQRSTVLPTLSLDALPAGSRAALRAAYEAARQHPQDSEAAGRLGMLLHAYQQHRSAAACYGVARSLNPRSLGWHYLSGVAYAELGDHASAATAFRAALQIDGDYLPARIRLGNALAQMDDLPASRQVFGDLIREMPELALAHYGLARVAAAEGDRAAAIDSFRRAIELAPQFGAAHYALALAYREAGASDRAAQHMQSYAQLGARRPAVPDALLADVVALRQTARDFLASAARLAAAGRLAEAAALHHRAIEADGGSAQAHVNLIAIYGRLGLPERAREHYEAARRLEGSLADAHYNYGVLLTAASRDDEAVVAFRRALDVDPFHAAAHNNLAALLARQRRFDEAATHYRQALASDPQHPTARFNLGRVLALSGQTAQAADQLALALARAERRGDAAQAAAIRAELQKVGR